MAQPYQSNFGAASASAANDAEDRIQKLKAKAEEVAGTVAAEGKKAYAAAEKTAGQAYAAAEKTAEDAYDSTRRFVREQPVVAVGIAVTAAFAIGALWKLSQARRNEDLLDRVTNMLEPQYRALRRRF